MQAHELRKLITTFLVLALLAGSASLAFTSLSRQKSEGPAAQNTAQTQVPKIGDKAVVEDIATTRIEGYDLAAEFTPNSDPQSNFTDDFAKGLAYNFVKANPEGPDLASGTGIVPPNDLDSLADQYVTEAALTPTTYAIDKGRIKIAKNYTQDQLNTYLDTLEGVFNDASSSTGIAGVSAQSGGEITPDAMQASNFVIAQAQEKLYDAVVPAPAQKLQEQALTYLELNRKLTDLDYNTDPLKAVVFTTKFPELLAMEQTKLKAEAQSFADNQKQVSDGAQHPLFLASLVGIPTANAFIFHDIIHTVVSIANGTGIYGTWGQIIASNLKSIALQILKNQLVSRLIQQTIKWVQGGGKPQFITNWKSFLKDSAQGAANQFINSVAPHLCQQLRAFTTDFLRSNVPNSITGSRDPYQQFNCTLDQIVSSVKDFYNDFTAGGWLGLASLALQPQNNAWGAVILANEAATAQASQAQAASDANAQANQGYKGFTRCVAYTIQKGVSRSDLPRVQSDPNYQGIDRCYTAGSGTTTGDPVHYAYCYQHPDEGDCPEVLAGPPPSADPRYEVCDVRMCTPDGRQQTTPGGAVADQVSKSLGGTLDNIVNANDLAGLIAAVVDAAISKLTTTATNGLLGLFDGNPDNGGNGTSTSGGGGGTGGDGGLASLKAQVAQLINGYQSRVNNADGQNNSWPGTASSTQPLLVSVASTCTNLTADANQRLGAIDRIAPSVAHDHQTLQGISDQLASTSAAVASSTDAVAISDMVTALDAVNSTIATLETRITTRSGQLDGLNQDAQDDLRDRSCATPLTTLDE